MTERLADRYEIYGLDRVKPDSAPDIPTTVTDAHNFEAIHDCLYPLWLLLALHRDASR